MFVTVMVVAIMVIACGHYVLWPSLSNPGRSTILPYLVCITKLRLINWLFIRACFKKLPMILCFNTMRYTFNMLTMMKEKVNTHFSFPLELDMSPYMENNLIRKERLEGQLYTIISYCEH